MKLYRVMKVDPSDGRPLVGTRRNMLGVRPTDPTSRDPKRRSDVAAVAGSDPVVPGSREGLSVTTDPGRLHPAPGEVVWVIDTAAVAAVVAVPDNPPHHVLEPVGPTTLDDYQATLAATRELWVRVTEGDANVDA